MSPTHPHSSRATTPPETDSPAPPPNPGVGHLFSGDGMGTLLTILAYWFGASFIFTAGWIVGANFRPTPVGEPSDTEGRARHVGAV